MGVGNKYGCGINGIEVCCDGPLTKIVLTQWL